MTIENQSFSEKINKKKTFGQIVNELMEKPDEKQGTIDTMREVLKTWYPEINTCIENHKHWNRPYFIQTILKRERIAVNSIRQYFVAMQAMPIAQNDQSVYFYNPNNEQLLYLWTVPDIGTIEYLINNEKFLIEEGDVDLLYFSKLFKAGTLESVISHKYKIKATYFDEVVPYIDKPSSCKLLIS